MWKRVLCLGWVGLVVACSDGSDADSGSTSGGGSVVIAEGALSGVVGDEPWSLVTAQSDAFLSDGEADFWVDLYAETVESCGLGLTNTSKHHIILNVPKKLGDYALSPALNATFVVDNAEGEGENLIAMEGRLVVDEISATQIRGGANIRFDEKNNVSGRFEIAICAD